MSQPDHKPRFQVTHACSQGLTVMRVAVVSMLAGGLLALAIRRVAAARRCEPPLQAAPSPGLPPVALTRRPWKAAAFDRAVAVIAAAAAVIAVLPATSPAATGLAAGGARNDGRSYDARPPQVPVLPTGKVLTWKVKIYSGSPLADVLEAALTPPGADMQTVFAH